MKFDTKEAMKSGTFVCGMTGSGKSDLAMRFAEEMMKEGVLVYVFDPAQAWQKQSNVPNVSTIRSTNSTWLPSESTIFDISMMTILDQQEFIENFCRMLFMNRALSEEDPPTWLVFEEAQLYLPQGALRAKGFQELVRVVSVGRNYNIKFCLVTPFASQVDKYIVKLCGQRYFGYTCEPNDIKYLKGYLEERVEELKKMKAGQFFYECRGDKEHIYSEEYQAELKPKAIRPPEPIRLPYERNPSINWPFIVLGLVLFIIMLLTW